MDHLERLIVTTKTELNNVDFNNRWVQLGIATTSVLLVGIGTKLYLTRKYSNNCNAILPCYSGNNVKLFNIPENGAAIAYDEFGDPNGFPMIYFHGAYLNHLEALQLEQIGKKYKIRFIAFDRPGFGKSTFPNIIKTNSKLVTNLPKYYSMESYMKDISKLIKHLNIDNESDINNGDFGIVGNSQGGLFAISGLYYLSKQCRKAPKFVTLMSGLPLTKFSNYLDSGRNGVGSINIDHPYTDAISSIQRNQVLNCNKFGMRFGAYLLRWFVLYFPNVYINRVLDLFKNSRFDLNELNSHMNVGYRKGKGTYEEEAEEPEEEKRKNTHVIKTKDIMWQIAFYGMKNKDSVRANLWSCQMQYNNNYAFDLQNVENKHVKIFMYYGKYDVLYTQKWANLYYDELKNYYGFDNIQFTLDNNAGHCLNDQARDKVFENVRNFLDNPESSESSKPAE